MQMQSGVKFERQFDNEWGVTTRRVTRAPIALRTARIGDEMNGRGAARPSCSKLPRMRGNASMITNQRRRIFACSGLNRILKTLEQEMHVIQFVEQPIVVLKVK
jgi:hypothetical protein